MTVFRFRRHLYWLPTVWCKAPTDWWIEYTYSLANHLRYPEREAMITDACVPLSRLSELITVTRAALDASWLPAPIIAHAGRSASCLEAISFHLTSPLFSSLFFSTSPSSWIRWWKFSCAAYVASRCTWGCKRSAQTGRRHRHYSNQYGRHLHWGTWWVVLTDWMMWCEVLHRWTPKFSFLYLPLSPSLS